MDWIRVEQELPEINVWVLVSACSSISIAKLFIYETGDVLWAFYHSNWIWMNTHPEEKNDLMRNDTTHADQNGYRRSINALDISHWMPLPQAPRIEK